MGDYGRGESIDNWVYINVNSSWCYSTTSVCASDLPGKIHRGGKLYILGRMLSLNFYIRSLTDSNMKNSLL